MKKSMMANSGSTESGRGQGRSNKGEADAAALQGLGDEDVDSQLASALGNKGQNGSSGKGARSSEKGAQSSKSDKSDKSAKAPVVEGSMDPFALLKSHHQEVDSLFEEIEHSNQARGRMTILKEILVKLEAHALIEEKIFYPRGAKADAKQTMECFEEHRLCRLLMRELGRMGATDKLLMVKVKVLKDLVQHHVKEEEQEYFEKVRGKYNEKQLQALGLEMKEEFDRIVQRLMGAGRTGAGRRSKAPAGRTGSAKSTRSTATAASAKKRGPAKGSKAGSAGKAAGGRKGGRATASRSAQV